LTPAAAVSLFLGRGHGGEPVYPTKRGTPPDLPVRRQSRALCDRADP
jgi:hypothetical protein